MTNRAERRRAAREARRAQVREARRRMSVSRPIAPIDDHFFEADPNHQGAVGCLTVAAFFRSLRAVRRGDP